MVKRITTCFTIKRLLNQSFLLWRNHENAENIGNIDAIFNPTQHLPGRVTIRLWGDRKPGVVKVVKLPSKEMVRIPESKHGGIGSSLTINNILDKIGLQVLVVDC